MLTAKSPSRSAKIPLRDSAVTRTVFDDTLTFVMRATSASYQTALRASLGDATAAGYVHSGRFKEAADEYVNDQRFAPLKDREDFQALFTRT
jgi:AMMECR1 domain-containing protein